MRDARCTINASGAPNQNYETRKRKRKYEESRMNQERIGCGGTAGMNKLAGRVVRMEIEASRFRVGDVDVRMRASASASAITSVSEIDEALFVDVRRLGVDGCRCRCRCRCRLRSIDRSTVRPQHIRLPRDIRSRMLSSASSSFGQFRSIVHILSVIIPSVSHKHSRINK